MIKVVDIEKGDIFSEISHYSFLGKTKDNRFEFVHHESKKNIVLDESYVSELLTSADQHETEIIVGKEDKFWTQKQIDELLKQGNSSIPRVGDLKLKGIRTIWEEIHSSQVFMVCFTKQDKPLSAKKFQELKDAQILDALNRIQAVKDAKKGVANAAALILKELQEKPILPYEKGEERILRGYKIQFSSINGQFDVVDMDIVDKNNIRQVNINTLLWLSFQGTKYILE